ncbi:hypothetical protein RRG08_024136 [Elysia crispata]|uniref:Uncharacterized protein n=1 Tax=Elysia crispata TaxID=231223 RepID=A0AAE0YPV9_9GAST|nr:hypothetical protein RRG08_024136 [Elysia crispata]
MPICRSERALVSFTRDVEWDVVLNRNSPLWIVLSEWTRLICDFPLGYYLVVQMKHAQDREGMFWVFTHDPSILWSIAVVSSACGDFSVRGLNSKPGLFELMFASSQPWRCMPLRGGRIGGEAPNSAVNSGAMYNRGRISQRMAKNND